MMEDIRKSMRDIRRNFDWGSLDESDLPIDPIELLKKWLEIAIKNEIKDSNAFVLSTVYKGIPDSRVLLIRDITEHSVHFYTNYGSKKSQDIEKNSKVAINIFWPELERQIRLQADVKRLSESKSDDYFSSRPRASQIGAWASNQSQLIMNRDSLESKVKFYEKKFANQDVPRPDFWGGYEAIPFEIEFWQGRPNRLHDRIVYTSNENSWNIHRLNP